MDDDSRTLNRSRDSELHWPTEHEQEEEVRLLLLSALALRSSLRMLYVRKTEERTNEEKGKTRRTAIRAAIHPSYMNFVIDTFLALYLQRLLIQLSLD